MTRFIDRRNLFVVAAVLAIALAMSSTAYAVGKGTIGSREIKNSAVKTKDLADGAVTSAKTQDGSLTGEDLEDRSVAGADLADGSVSGAKVADGSLTGADLQDGSVNAEDLTGASVGSEELAGIIAVSNTSGQLGDDDGSTNGGSFGQVWTQVTCPAGTTVLSGAAEWVEPTSGVVDTKNLYIHSMKRVGNGWWARGIVDMGAQGMVKLRVTAYCLGAGGPQT